MTSSQLLFLLLVLCVVFALAWLGLALFAPLALRDRLRRDYGAEGFEELFVRLDLLHDYAAAGRIGDLTTLSPAELRGWL